VIQVFSTAIHNWSHHHFSCFFLSGSLRAKFLPLIQTSSSATGDE